MSIKMIIAGGGTGGHIFPGLAVARELMARDKKNSVLFVGSTQGIENRVVPEEGFNLKRLHIKGFKGKYSWQTLRVLILLPWAIIHSVFIIMRYKPDVVLGVGGYSSGPLLLAALLCKRLSFVQEQNIFPGKTNRFLGRFVKCVFISFPQTAKFFDREKTLCTGNPVRVEILSLPDKNSVSIAGLDKKRFTVLVFGGSLGAHKINEAVTEALEFLVDIKDEIQFIHQTGETDLPWVKERYSGFCSQVNPFIHKMDEVYSYADMVICRAGASTLAELTHVKKPSLLIPYPFAAENHQEKNARILARAGAAFVLKNSKADGEKIAKIIRHICFHPPKKMGQRIGKFSKDGSASQIVNFVCKEVDSLMV